MPGIVEKPFVLPTLLPTEALEGLQKYALYHWMYKPNYNFDLGRHEFFGEQVSSVHHELTEIAKDYFGSETLQPTWSLGTIYQYQHARVPRGVEDRACDYNLDLAVFQKTAWPLSVEYEGSTEQHTLAENDALCYCGNKQPLWREDFPDPEHNLLINVLFCYAEPDHWFFKYGAGYIEVLRGRVSEAEYLAGRGA